MTAILYQTTNLYNGKFYIGVTSRLKRRSYLGSGSALKAAIAKYGECHFVRQTIAVFDTLEEAFDAERKIVTPEFIARPDTYNLGGGGRGRSFTTSETCQRISDSRSGVAVSGDHKEKLRRANLGKKHTPETRAKMSKAHMGHNRKHTPETRAKMSASRLGKKLTEQHKRNIGLGRKRATRAALPDKPTTCSGDSNKEK